MKYYISKGILTKDGKKYNYEYMDLFGLLLFYKLNEKLGKSFLNYMRSTRSPNFELIDLTIEHFISLQDKYENTFFLLVHNNKEIISTIRWNVKKQNVYISCVATTKNYRRQGFCTSSVKKMISISKKFNKAKNFKLEVYIDNINAIRCYEHVGFKIKKTIKDIRPYHLMEL